MDNVDRLVQFIDLHTQLGTQELPEIFGEGVGAEAVGIECLNQFIDRDWWRLGDCWQAKSDNWIAALIFLLADVDNGNVRELLGQIVRLGSDESSLNAILILRGPANEQVRVFIDELNPAVRSAIEIKISRIIASRIAVRACPPLLDRVD